MQSRLEPAHYLDPAVFALEQQQLFGRLWIYAGLRSALAHPDAYFTRTIGGTPVVVVQRNGQLRAFENTCPHRQMPIYPAAFGEKRAVCPYHGWVFDLDGDPQGGGDGSQHRPAGRVKAIPQADTLYRYTDTERETLGLRRIAVANIGELVFINLAADPPPLDEQFEPSFQQLLRNATAHFGPLSIHGNVEAACNWKFNHENVLDYNHVAYVHQKSFLPMLGKAAVAHAVPLHVAGQATLAGQSFATQTPLKITPQPWHSQVDRYRGAGDDTERYYNFFIYPNVNFISVGGLSFLVQQFEPVDAGHTHVRLTLTTARETQPVPGLPAVLWGHLRGEAAVLHEDIPFLEALQRNLHAKAPSAQHGHYENRLMDAAEVYLRLMEQA